MMTTAFLKSSADLSVARTSHRIDRSCPDSSDVAQASVAGSQVVPTSFCLQELHGDASQSVATAHSTITVTAAVLLPAPAVQATRSDDRVQEPVRRRWFEGSLQACRQDCESVIALSTRQIAALGDEPESRMYADLKIAADRAIVWLDACRAEFRSRSVPSGLTLLATADACTRIADRADDFPFDGWVTRCAVGCELLAQTARQAFQAGCQ